MVVLFRSCSSVIPSIHGVVHVMHIGSTADGCSSRADADTVPDDGVAQAEVFPRRAYALALAVALAVSVTQTAQAQHYTESVLYSFAGGTDGTEPLFSGVIRDPTGNLYGTTYAGGASNAGTVFKVDMSGNETVLYSF